jgi:23S rRNA (guanine745-N1)-methyltransferase
MSQSIWQCPVCKALLAPQLGSWRCANNHSFDSAKEGYINLLLPQHKNSQAPGDSKEMISARRSFLSSGAYEPLAQKLSELIHHHIVRNEANEAPALLDAGCGEAYYSGFIKRLWQGQGEDLQVSGIDISKPAVQKAAKANPQAQYAVASTYNIPISDGSVQAVLQIFSPSSTKEVQRILASNGIWITVNPAQQHLFELKEYVYQTVQEHQIDEQVPEGFTLLESIRLTFKCELATKAQRESLLLMTPFYWRISDENKTRLYEGLKHVSADFDVRIFAVN